MVAVVSTERLTMGRQPSAGVTRHLVPMITEEELTAIRACVAKAFGFAASAHICEAHAQESKIVVDAS
jgi:hypothetical protein